MHIDTIKSYTCATCDVSLRLSECHYDDFEGEYYCPFCENRHVTVSSERPAEWFSVAIYEVHNTYGGPEEGGWYYNAGYRVDETVRTFRNTPEGRDEADRYLTSLHALHFPQRRERWHSDCFSSRVYAEALPDAHFPLRRPVYC